MVLFNRGGAGAKIFHNIFFKCGKLTLSNHFDTSPGKFAVKENTKDPVKFRMAKNVGLIAGGTGRTENYYYINYFNVLPEVTVGTMQYYEIYPNTSCPKGPLYHVFHAACI